MNRNQRGILIHAQDFGPYWTDLAAKANLTTLGLHPVPETPEEDPRSFEALLKRVSTRGFRETVMAMRDRGMSLNVEAHAMHWLLPRREFSAHPDWFRMDQGGRRIPDLNLCPSNPEALNAVGTRVVQFVDRIGEFVDTHRYHLWMDDNSQYCHCAGCRGLSPSDQALLVYNRMVEAIRLVDPQGTLAYLAYQATLPVPTKVAPSPGLFLEFAPVDRDSRFPIVHPEVTKNRTVLSHLPSLIAFFGKEGSQVLEYWMDNSYFYRWTLPYGELPFYGHVLRKDVELYQNLGFQNLSSFACGLNLEYEKEYGVPPVVEYGKILKEQFSG